MIEAVLFLVSLVVHELLSLYKRYFVFGRGACVVRHTFPHSLSLLDLRSRLTQTHATMLKIAIRAVTPATIEIIITVVEDDELDLELEDELCSGYQFECLDRLYL